MRHCNNCDQPVRPIKRISWPIAIVLVITSFFLPLLGIPLLIVYLVYYAVLKRRICPMCHAHNFRMTDAQQSDWERIKSGRIIDIVGGRKHK